MTLSSRGPVVTSASAGPAAQFVSHEQAAWAASGQTVHASSLLMLTSGLSLARANCRQYFASMGKEQRNLIVSRQALNAVGALATTLMLMENVDPDSITLVELGQGAANTGLDIYTENYLFAAENIESVRELVFKALDAHADGAFALQPFDYAKAADLIMEHQSICQPRPIAALVLKAIQAGNVRPDPALGGAGALPIAQDRTAGRELAQLFGQPGVLSDDQVGALWWLLMGSSSPTTRKGPINTLLGDLASTVLEDGELNSGWTGESEARRILMMLSPASQAALAATATNAQRAANAAQQAAVDQAAENPGAAAADLQQFLSSLTSDQRRQFQQHGDIPGLKGWNLVHSAGAPPVVVQTPTPPSFTLPVQATSRAASVPLQVD